MAIYKSLVHKVSIHPDKKTKQKDYEKCGQLPIVDQGQLLIGGYSNALENRLICDLPVIVFGDHTRIVKYINFPFGAGADGIKVLEPKESVLPKYLYYGTQYLVLKLRDHGYARHYQFIEKMDLPIPSYSGQEHIISRIEELFSQLDASVAELKTAKERLKVYRQAVLSSCLGKGISLPISECLESIGQGWSPKCDRKSVTNDNDWAVITTTSVQPMKFSFMENKKLPKGLPPREKHELQVGDILITRAGPRSRCGICCMVKTTKKHLLNCDKVYCLKVNRSLILPEYLEAVLNAPNFQKEIAFCKTGGNDSGVNLTQSRFLSIKIPIPDVETQVTILSDINASLSICDDIEKTIDAALQQAEALQQSILKKAFEGGL